MGEVLPWATLVEEGSGSGAPDLLLEFEAQTVSWSHQADVSFAGRTNEEKARE